MIGSILTIIGSRVIFVQCQNVLHVLDVSVLAWQKQPLVMNIDARKYMFFAFLNAYISFAFLNAHRICGIKCHEECLSETPKQCMGGSRSQIVVLPHEMTADGTR